MKQYTPETEAEHVSEDTETYYFKFIHRKVTAYSKFGIDDVLIDESSKIKYRITYIEPRFKLIYGRRVCISGALSKNLHHITGMHSTFIQDPDQINALLLGEEYNPSAKLKMESQQKKDAFKQRKKQRCKIPKGNDDSKTWCMENMKIGQDIWITSNAKEDRCANLYRGTVADIGQYLRIVNAKNGSDIILIYPQLHHFNVYLTCPVVYEGQ